MKNSFAVVAVALSLLAPQALVLAADAPAATPAPVAKSTAVKPTVKMHHKHTRSTKTTTTKAASTATPATTAAK